MSGQAQQVIATLRNMIVAGELKPGQRVAEIPISERLGVSRTPIRIALQALAQEGLLVSAGGRGLMVREISAEEVREAIEVRGVLEGLAASTLARAGMGRNVRTILHECLDEGDALFAKGHLTGDDLDAFSNLNATFHRTIVQAAGNSVVEETLARNDHLPLASATSIAVDREALDRDFRRLNLAHLQHHLIVDALENQESARAEALMREHANAARRYAELFGQSMVDVEHYEIVRAKV